MSGHHQVNFLLSSFLDIVHVPEDWTSVHTKYYIIIDSTIIIYCHYQDTVLLTVT